MKDKREADLKEVYHHLDEKLKEKMEKIAISLFVAQMVVENEKVFMSENSGRKTT